MEKQPIPEDSKCPQCGGEPTDESEINHHLSQLGYVHDDIEMKCSECGYGWYCGVPIGEYEGELAEELFCDSCESRYMLVHRVLPRPGSSPPFRYRLHLKCPNGDCNYFKKVDRKTDNHGIGLVGYPQITGEMGNHVEDYGWESDLPAEVLTREKKEELCPEPACIQHGDGTVGCPLPAIESAIIESL